MSTESKAHTGIPNRLTQHWIILILSYIYICDELIDSDSDCHCILILILKQEDANDADDADDTVSIGKTGLMWSLASKS